MELMGKVGELRRRAGEPTEGAAALRAALQGRRQWLGSRDPKAWVFAPQLAKALQQEREDDPEAQIEPELGDLTREFFEAAERWAPTNGLWLRRKAEMHAAHGQHEEAEAALWAAAEQGIAYGPQASTLLAELPFRDEGFWAKLQAKGQAQDDDVRVMGGCGAVADCPYPIVVA